MTKPNTKKTGYPGISRLGPTTFQVRVRTRDPFSKKRREKEEIFEGSLEQARHRQLELLAMVKGTTAVEAPSTPATRPAPRGPILSVYARQWLEHVVAKGVVRESFIATRVPVLEGLVLPFLGAATLGQIDEVLLEQWAGWLAQRRKKNGEAYAQETLRNAWAVLRWMLNDARRLVGLRVEAAQSFELKVGGTLPKKKARLSADELRKLLAVAAEDDVGWAAQIWLQAVTGMRHSEVTGLFIRDLDLTAGSVSVERGHVQGVLGETKTAGSRRLLPVPEEAARLLSAHLQRRRERGETLKPDDLVFPSERGTPRFVQATNKKLAELCAKAGIDKHITSHCFRHGLNDLVRRSNGEVVARKLLGHVTSQSTQTYSDVDLPEAAIAQQRALGPLPDPGAGGAAGGTSGGVEVETPPGGGMWN